MIAGFIKGAAPFVRVRVVSSNLGLDYNTDFLIDSGAARCALAPRDLLKSGLNVEEPIPGDEVGGIGGVIKTRVIPDSELNLPGQPPLRLPLHVLIYPLETLAEADYNHAMRIPSLLGRDVINDLDLFYSYSKGQVTLTPL